MAKKKKQLSRFGLPSGRYSSTRKSVSLFSGRQKSEFECHLNVQEDFKIKLIRKFRSLKRNKAKRINLWHKCSKKNYYIYRSKEGKYQKHKVTNITASGYRLINLKSMQDHFTEITTHTMFCEAARTIAYNGGSAINLESQLSSYGLACILSARCTGCQKQFVLETSPKLKTEGSNHYDINVRATWGSLTSGNGLAQLNELMSTMDSPSMTQKTFSTIENEINHWWENMLEEDLKCAIEEEKLIAIENNRFHEGVPSISVICDGGWSKRSHKHTYNALGGVAIIIGVETKKILHVGVRNKFCYICNRAKTLKLDVQEHECFKNWDKSSQAMEADIIVEGFLKADKHGIRYMHLIGDGDSSVYSQIQQKVPVWGKHVKKIECANHTCKCLRSNLEKLVVETPTYKGKGKLCKRTRIRITSAVRCAIRMRSKEKDKLKAAKQLEFDIRNTLSHVYGDHTRCSEFCKAGKASKTNAGQHIDLDNDDTDDNVFTDQASMWSDGTSLEAQEESRFDYDLFPSDLDSAMRQDIALILNNVAKKSISLIGNFTTNLAECWMHMRSKFDGGKMFNHCNRGSWHTRCYGAALRFNRGPKWSTSTWQDITNTIPGYHFDKLFTQRQLALENNNIIKSKPEIKSSRWKRKMASVKEGNTKKARMHYGNQSIQVEEDITKSELEGKKTIFMEKNYNLELSHIKEIEKHTKLQITSASWMDERKKRLTASNFGLVYKRNPKIPVTPLVNSLLYSTFKGNKATRLGLREERVTIQEYIQQKAKQKVKVKVENMGLVVDEEVQFLGASPDGKVMDEHNNLGLIEIKNVLHNKEMTLLQATSSIKNFCLEKNNNHELKLKKTHNYYYQCQGLMNICKLPWIDFIVRTTNPYDMNIDRIYRDSVLWEQNLLPKLKAFFLNAMLPELSHPRHNKYPGIREPGIWYNVSIKGSTPGPSKKKTVHDHDDTDDESTKTDFNPLPPLKRNRRKCSTIKFLGRRIAHEWILEDGCKKWFKGLVLSVLKKSDGDVNAVYEIKYDGEDDANEVQHKELLEDYRNSSLKFIDI